ncbi:hypothetical protein [Streptomyces formicae]|uniref:Integral membrane protein n=1 Tax=Streptomyces formicae TaxID=1616117 RepID=A0ABY3WNY1_9ACTN|nr:hypothetical protein [Streptomyces formicae]UNM12290.1 hypothetical protein J4032_12790 [Streptomyces formicae]
MSARKNLVGRLLGGLSRIRVRLGDRARLAAFLRRERPAAKRIAWALFEGLVGAAVGLGVVTLWLANR